MLRPFLGRYLKDERGEEYEEVLEEERHTRVHVGGVERLPALLIVHHVLAKQDPARTDQGPETYVQAVPRKGSTKV